MINISATQFFHNYKSSIESDTEESNDGSQPDTPNSTTKNATNTANNNNNSSSNGTGNPTLDFANKKQAMDAFKELLREKLVSSKATWEQALKLIAGDSR